MSSTDFSQFAGVLRNLALFDKTTLFVAEIRIPALHKTTSEPEGWTTSSNKLLFCLFNGAPSNMSSICAVKLVAVLAP